MRHGDPLLKCFRSKFRIVTVSRGSEVFRRGPARRAFLKVAGPLKLRPRGQMRRRQEPLFTADEDSQEHLANALFASSRQAGVELHFNKGLAGAPSDAVKASDTAMNPAVLTAFALAISADGFTKL